MGHLKTITVFCIVLFHTTMLLHTISSDGHTLEKGKG